METQCNEGDCFIPTKATSNSSLIEPDILTLVHDGRISFKAQRDPQNNDDIRAVREATSQRKHIKTLGVLLFLGVIIGVIVIIFEIIFN